MPHAIQKPLKDKILQHVPKQGYKNGIRVDNERYKQLMMCFFRSAYTKEEICEAVDQLWRLLR